MMKKLCIFMLFLLTTNVWAQSSGFNYKALITNNGTALATQSVDVKFTLLDGTSTAVYEETHATTTDANGIVSVLLGEGAVVSGDFSTIDWTNNYSLKVEIDTQDGSGYQDFGTNPFKYVPYAKYAEKAGNVFSGDFDDLTNVPAGIADGDDDTQLTEVQVDAMVANNGYLTTEVDGSITNELQNLSLQNDTLSISNGNRVIFANWDTDVTDDVHSLNDLSDARSNSYSVYLGNNSGAANNSSINNNVGVGTRALEAATNAEKNVAVGYEAMQNNLVGKSNVAVGDRAIFQNLKDYNTAIGFNTLYDNENGYRNVALGYRAGYRNRGSSNVFVGSEAGYNELGSNKLYIDNSNTTSPLIYGDFSTNNIVINGKLAIKDGTQANGRVFTSDAYGRGHWQSITAWDTNAGDDVTEIDDLSDARTVNHSIYLGAGSGLHDNGTDNRNTAIGYRAMDSITSGSSNVAVGFEALFSNKTHYDNIAIGDRSLYKNNGRGNTGLGFNTLYENLSGSHNVAIGRNAGRNNQGSNNIYIGYHAGFNATGDNKLYIDNSDTDEPLIYGDFSSNYVKINGELQGQDSGSADMKAYVYGSVTSSGQKVASASSIGFTASKLGSGIYKILFTHPMSSATAYTIIATIGYGSGIGFIRVRNYNNNEARVYIYNASGNLSDKPFNFIVFKK